MVFTLAASMLVGTPLTASAAGIRGVYSISDGNETVKENPNDSGTGTVTNTDTNTGSGVLRDNDAAIIGIVLDRNIVNAEKGRKEKLTATVVLDEDLIAEGKAEEIRTALAGKIRWELSNADDEDGKDKKRNPAAYVSINTLNGAGDRTVLELNPKKGTKKGEEVVVTASIEGSWYFEKDEDGNYKRDENGKLVVKERKDKLEGYTVSATVSVKEYSDELSIVGEGDVYVKHTLDLMDDNSKYHLVREPATANDEITWISTNTKVATVNAAGVVTFKKVNADDEGNLTGDACQIIAVGERGVKSKPWDVKVKAGTPASKVVIVNPAADKDENGDYPPFDKKKETIDLGNDQDAGSRNVEVIMKAKVKAAVGADGKPVETVEEAINLNEGKDKPAKYKSKTVELSNDTRYVKVSPNDQEATLDVVAITDEVIWTSAKPAIVKVIDQDTEAWTATLEAKSVGSAAITAKASSGKSDKLTVAVTATLTNLEIGDENGEDFNVTPELYSGQSMQLTAIRTPSQNKDGVKWSIAKTVQKKNKDGSLALKNNEPIMIANPNASINAKGVLTVKAKLDPLYAEDDVEVALVSSKKYDKVNAEGETVKAPVEAENLVVTITQSSIDNIYVYEGETLVASAVTEYKDDDTKFKKIVKNGDISKDDNTKTINVPKGKTFDIEAEVTKGFDMRQADATKTLSFKSSSTKVATVNPTADGSKLTVTANAKGSSTVTVSGIRVNGTKASAISTTFKVNVVQPVMTLTMNKPEVTINEKYSKNVLVDQTVALKVTLGPKGVNAKEAIKWEVKQTKKNGKDIPGEFDLAVDAKGKTDTLTKASASVKLTKPTIGDQFVIKASTKSGATATATINVVTKSTAVAIARTSGLVEDKDKWVPQTFAKNTKDDAKIGQTFTIYPYVNVGTAKAPDWQVAGKYVDATDDEAAKNVEDVTYSVNKKGIVTVDADGTVHVLNKGTVTITAKTPQGKKGTLKVVVKDLSLYNPEQSAN